MDREPLGDFSALHSPKGTSVNSQGAQAPGTRYDQIPEPQRGERRVELRSILSESGRGLPGIELSPRCGCGAWRGRFPGVYTPGYSLSPRCGQDKCNCRLRGRTLIQKKGADQRWL
jgi:hypothetical protein